MSSLSGCLIPKIDRSASHGFTEPCHSLMPKEHSAVELEQCHDSALLSQFSNEGERYQEQWRER